MSAAVENNEIGGRHSQKQLAAINHSDSRPNTTQTFRVCTACTLYQGNEATLIIVSKMNQTCCITFVCLYFGDQTDH